MHAIFLTPSSISYLTQFILALAITLFLLNRLRSQRACSLVLLTAFFAPLAILTGLLVMNAAFLPFYRLLTAYAENTVLALALVALIGFAYHFPERYPQHKWEMRILLALSLAFLVWEAGFMLYRYDSLLNDGNVFNRFSLAAYSQPVVMLFAPLAFLRQTLAADPRPVAWWRKLWQPEGKDARGARNFALVFVIPFVLSFSGVFISFGLPFTVFNATVSIGILLMFWLFVNNYVNFIPGSVNVASRLSILMLTLFLALIGTLGWLIAPSYAATFRPDFKDYQTLRFTPNATGGYEVNEVAFHFERALGEKVDAQTLDENGNHRVAFSFPFYGANYTDVYAHHSGILSLGETFRPLNLEAAVARVPNIFPLRMKLAPNPAEADSGLYIRQEPEHLIITWNRLLASQPEARYTFQTVLYADGTFDFSYNGLPQPILFSPDASPPANPWLRGVVAGRGEPLHELPAGIEEPTDLVSLARAGASPLLENHLLAFRRSLHAFMLPVAWVVMGGSLLILIIIPLLLRASIARPLEALTAGVRRMGAGEMDITLPVQTDDEIGFLTGAFNTMSGALDDHVRNLETRVAERTRELNDVNARLRESEEKFYKAFHSSPDLVVITRLSDGRFVEVSESFSRIIGYSREEALNASITTFDIWRSRSDRESFIQTLQSKGVIRAAEYQFRTKSGEVRTGLLSAEIIQLGDEPHIVAIIHDITERKLADEKLRASEERFRGLIVSAPDAILLVGQDGKIAFANVEAEHLLGYSLDEFTGMDIEKLLPQYFRQSHTAHRAAYMDAPRTRIMGTRMNLMARHKNGDEIPVDIKLSPVNMDSRTQVVAFVRDITERKQAEEQLQQAQAQILEQQRFVAAFEERERLARELHDGLGQTFGFVNLQTQAAHTLIQQGQGSEASALLSRLADVTQDAHRDLRGYIQNLKNVAPAARQEFFAVLENYCLHLWQAYFFKVRLILPQDFPATLASPQVEMHLTYIIREALGNARRYSGKNEASVRIDVEENYLEVIIQDDGVGFETGYSGPERRKNAHYGLAIMRERAQEVGGSISIESAPGRGTRITVRLPRNLPREGLPPENILIVDDHPLFVEGLKNMLVVHGAQVAGVARDGAQAIEMATALQPGLILMDIHMPRMGGLEATRRIKEVMPGVKIVMLTTSADEAEVYEALRVGASGYLLKGMNKDEFIVTLAGVSRGEVEFSTEVAKQILSEFSDQTTPGGPGEATQPGSLSERQMVILRMVAQGLQYKEIGERLFITERTVKYHVGEILTRLQLKNKRDMQAYARRAGLA